MLGTFGLIAAIGFVGLCLYRLRAPKVPGWAPVALALAAGLGGIAEWRGGADSRWLVGAILLLAAAPSAWAGARNRRLVLVGLLLGVLGTALFGIATISPPARPTSPAPARS